MLRNNKRKHSNLKVETPFLSTSSDVPSWIRKFKKSPKGAAIPLVHKKNILKALRNIKVNDPHEKKDVVCVALFPVYLLRKYKCIPNTNVRNSLGIPIKMLQRWNEERLRREIIWSTNIYESHWHFLNWIENNSQYDDYFIPCIGYRGWKGSPPDIQLGITGTIEYIRDNSKKVNISSYLVKESDIIEVKDNSKKLNIIEGSISSKERDVPEYIELDNKNKSVKLIRIPKFSEVPYPVIMEPNLVIEYYSR